VTVVCHRDRPSQSPIAIALTIRRKTPVRRAGNCRCGILAPKMTLIDRTAPVLGARISNGAVLSLFPGADLLGRGFEQAGYLVMRGPDKLWGQCIEDFRGRAGIVEGVIGGPPCQDFSSSRKAALRRAKVCDLLAHFVRVVGEFQPDWFLMENVPAVPDIAVLVTRSNAFTWPRRIAV
jgi:hypothetical protein